MIAVQHVILYLKPQCLVGFQSLDDFKGDCFESGGLLDGDDLNAGLFLALNEASDC
jgi:hypothetical protein